MSVDCIFGCCWGIAAPEFQLSALAAACAAGNRLTTPRKLKSEKGYLGGGGGAGGGGGGLVTTGGGGGC